MSEFVPPTVEELAPLFPAYEIRSFIAQGGMGAVYKARQLSLDRPVAIKILPREFGVNEDFRDYFKEEARAMARLNHPNLIGIYDFGDVEGMPFIIMEFIKGKALYYSAHKKAIDPPVALKLVSTICQALHHAHKAGIVHRDIKPANILLDMEANPKIGDFGLSKPAGPTANEGLVYGTEGYTAPEVYRRAPSDHRVDIFSVGAVLCELLTGKRPKAHSYNMSSGIDRRIDAIIQKATHQDLHQRHETAKKLSEEIDELIPKLSGPKLATGFSKIRPVTSAGQLLSTNQSLSHPTQFPPTAILTGNLTSTLASHPSTRPVSTASQKKKSSLLPTAALLTLLVGGLTAIGFKILNSKEDLPTPSQLPPSSIESPALPETDTPSGNNTTAQSDPLLEMRRAERQKRRASQEGHSAHNFTPLKNQQGLSSLEQTQSSAQVAMKIIALKIKDQDFTDLPPGAIKKGNSIFFYVQHKRSWLAANRLGNRHSASIAKLSTPEDLEWFLKTYQPDKFTWLGATDCGLRSEKKWLWADGESVDSNLFKNKSPIPQTEPLKQTFFVAVSNNEPLLSRFSLRQRLPTLYEWKTDGNTDSLFNAQLERSTRSLKLNQSPHYPQGTFRVGNSHFLVIKKNEISWTEASNLAKVHRGSLAVPSNKEELEVLNHVVDNLIQAIGMGCWIDGFLPSMNTPRATWTNLSNEPFTITNWRDATVPSPTSHSQHLALCKLGGVFAHALPDQNPVVKHLIIEWNNSKKTTTATTSNNSSKIDNYLARRIEKIRKPIHDRYRSTYAPFRKKRDRIVSSYLDQLITETKKQDSLNPQTSAALIASLRTNQSKKQLPQTIPDSLPDTIKDHFEDATKALERHDATYKQNFKNAQRDYLSVLTKEAARAKNKSEVSLLRILEAEIIQTETNQHSINTLLNGEPIQIPTSK